MPRTLFDKIWDAHEVAPSLLYIDLHLVHEVTSPQAFDGLRLAGRAVRRADRIIVLVDGKIVQTGNFAELSNTPGMFASFAERQLL